MSIRVYKQIGYGLADLRTKNDQEQVIPDDPRWDYEKFCANWRGAAEERDLPFFLEWCETHADRLRSINEAEGWVDDKVAIWRLTEAIKDRIKHKQGRTWVAPHSAVGWNSDFGMDGVVLFQPAHALDWTRYDDTIDYYDEHDDNGPVCRATFIPHSTGIYPHDGYLKRFREPSEDLRAKLSEATKLIQCFSFERDQTKDGADITQLTGGPYNQLVGRWDGARLPPLIKDEEVLRHYVEDWRPRVPLGVLAVIEFLNCFPKAFEAGGIVNSLRPMIYVHWR